MKNNNEIKNGYSLKWLLFFGLITLIFSSCVYNKKEPLKTFETIPTSIDTSKTITYTNFTQQIMSSYCVYCHSPSPIGQTPFLTNYTEVKQEADNGNIKATVIDGPNFMPPSGSLPQPIKDTLQMWLDQGALE